MARRGTDLLNGPIASTLIAFSLPTLASNVLQSLNGSINAVWVGRFLGEDALAATSTANILMFLTFAVTFGLGMAATVVVGQSWGRGDCDYARRVVGTALGALLGLSVLCAVLGLAFAPQLVRLMATPPESAAMAETYLRVMFVSLPASFASMTLMMALRGTGDALTPLWFMVIGCVLDVGLNPVLILGLGPVPALGIGGSALATAISFTASFAGLVAYIYARDLPLRLRGAELRYLRPDPAILRVVAAKGVPMGLQMLVISVAQLTVVGLVNRAGVHTAAAYGVALQLWGYLQMPAMALGAGVSAMAAQNIGAGRWNRVGRITATGIVGNLVMTSLLCALLLLFEQQLLALFVGADSPAVPIAAHIQRVASWGFILFGVTFVVFGTVRANGSVYGPLAILFVSLFPVRLGMILLLMPRFGTEAIWWASPVSSAVAMLMALAFYRWGRWREGRLLGRPPEQADAEAATASEPGGRIHPTA